MKQEHPLTCVPSLSHGRHDHFYSSSKKTCNSLVKNHLTIQSSLTYLMLLLEALLFITGRGVVMSLISDTDTRGDLNYQKDYLASIFYSI